MNIAPAVLLAKEEAFEVLLPLDTSAVVLFVGIILRTKRNASYFLLLFFPKFLRQR